MRRERYEIKPIEKITARRSRAVRVLSVTDRHAVALLVVQQNITVDRVFTNLE